MRTLEKREKIVLTAGAVIVLVMLGFWLTKGPLRQYEQSKIQVAQATQRLAQAQVMAEEIRNARRDRESVQKLVQARGPSYNLWTTVNRAVQTVHIADRAQTDSVPNFGGDATAVKLSLREVSMRELVELMHHIHATDNLVVLHQVSRLRPASGGKGLECEMILITPRA
jgi:type II secretory pathway component PulM